MDNAKNKKVVEVAPTLPVSTDKKVSAKAATKNVSKKKKETVAAPAAKVVSKKKETTIVPPAKPEMVKIFATTYHRYRHWIKNILAEGKINKFRFLKDETGWTGSLLVQQSEVVTAKKILADFKSKNAGTLDMWW